MATEKEKTLQIKDFKTISRFYSSPNENPNALQTIQNMYNITQGELAVMGGVEKLTATALPGVAKIIGTEIMTLKDGSERQLIYGTPDFTSIVNNTASSDFAAAGTGGTVNRTVTTVYVGFGGATARAYTSNVPFKSLGTTYTLRNDIASHVMQINFYVRVSNTTGGDINDYEMLCGSITRYNNVFPATFTFNRTPYDLNSCNTSQFDYPCESTPFYFSCTPTSTVGGSSLRENQIYYMGLSPNFVNLSTGQSYREIIPFIDLYDAANGVSGGPVNLLSYTVPKGYTEFTATFYGVPWFLNAGLSAPPDDPTVCPPIDGFNGFIGITPEDLSLNPDSTLNGKYTLGSNCTIAQDSYSITADSGTSKITFNTSQKNSFKEGMPIKFTGSPDTNTFVISGFTAAQVAASQFFIRDLDSDNGTFKLSYVLGGIALTITSDGTGAQTALIRKVSIVFHTIPENNCLGNYMSRYPTITGSGTIGNTSNVGYEDGGNSMCAAPLRSYGTFVSSVTTNNAIPNYNPSNTVNPSKNIVGIWALKGSTFSLTNSYQILPSNLERTFTLESPSSTTYTKPVASFFYMYNNGYSNNSLLNEPNFFFTKYAYRNYTTNGGQSPFYTNGYVAKPIQRNSTSSTATPPSQPYAIPPIASYIQLVNNKLIAAGGVECFANTPGGFYASDSSDPNSWGVPTSTTAPAPWNFFALDAGDTSPINGLGYYSQNLTQSGPSAFLLVSKANTVYSWNLLTGSNAIVAAIYNGSGFIGPRAFAVTNLGPCFVGKDNVYFVRSGNEIDPIGNEVKPILVALGDMGKFVTAVFHNNIFKFFYTPTIVSPTPDTALLDKEIWLQLNIEEGQTVKRFTGPHTLKSVYYQGNGKFSTYPNMRISSNGANLYLRDSTSVYTNDGSPIDCDLVWNQLTLQADHFIKLLTRLYARTKVNETITATISIDSYDQSGGGQGTSSGTPTTYTDTMTWTYNGPPQSYRLFQKLFTARIRGDIFVPSIAFSTSSDTRIVDVSFLYNVQRRRLL